MEVSKLTDTELNRAFLWLYAKNFTINIKPFTGVDKMVTVITDEKVRWGQVMPLVVKMRIDHNTTVCASGLDDSPIYQAYTFKHASDYCPSLLRAYIELLVIIALEEK